MMQYSRMSLPGTALAAALCLAGSAFADDLPRGGNITCKAPFSSRDKGVSLLARHKDIARIQEIAGLDGETFDAVVLYPDDPRARLEVEDQRGAGKGYITAVNVKGRDSVWTVEGVRTGMTLKELADVNGGTLTLSGFQQETDTTFAILGWLTRGDCQVAVIFMAPGRVDFDSPLYGNDVKSDDPRLLPYNLRVDALTLTLSTPPDDED